MLTKKAINSITFASAVVCYCFLGGVPAHSSNTEAVLKTGGVVGCSGQLTSAKHRIVGSLQLVPAGVATGGSYRVSGGIIGAAAANVITVDPLDTTALRIAQPSHPVKLNLYYSGGAEGAQGRLYYRYGGQTDYMSGLMTSKGDSSFSYSLDPDLFGIRGLEYYGEVFSNDQPAYTAGGPSNPRTIIVALDNTGGQRPPEFRLPEKQYRIVGLPLEPEPRVDNSIDAVFADDLGPQQNSTWRLARYESVGDTVIEYHDAQSGLQVVDDPARGYWLITSQGESYGAGGQSMRPDTVLDGVPYYQAGFTLDNGWNQLANPFPFDISWADVRFKVDGVVQSGHPAAIEDSAYWYDGAKYVAVSTIPAWEGIFVRVNSDDVQVLFPFREIGAAASGEQAENRDLAASGGQWCVKLSLSVEGQVVSELFIGVRPDAFPGVDRYDFASPPPPSGAPGMALHLPGGDPLPRRCDYRSALGDGAVWELSMRPATNRVLTLSGLNHIPDNMQAWMLPERGAPVLLTENGALELGNDVTSTRLVIGTQNYSDKELNTLLPRSFVLDQNFPNPFNPSTEIRLALPAEALIRLDLYNLLGRRVRTLADGVLEAGYHTLTWDGTDQNGRQVASGIYFYRITTANFTQSRKMLLLK